MSLLKSFLTEMPFILTVTSFVGSMLGSAFYTHWRENRETVVKSQLKECPCSCCKNQPYR